MGMQWLGNGWAMEHSASFKAEHLPGHSHHHHHFHHKAEPPAGAMPEAAAQPSGATSSSGGGLACLGIITVQRCDYLSRSGLQVPCMLRGSYCIPAVYPCTQEGAGSRLDAVPRMSPHYNLNMY